MVMQETTLIELASLILETELGNSILFTSEDPEELAYYGLAPSQYYFLIKQQLYFEEDYSLILGQINKGKTISKNIHLLSKNIDDEDECINGILSLIQNYYNQFMEHNKNNKIYLLE